MPSARSLSALVAAGRVAVGAALLAAPGPTARRWMGSPAETGGGGLAVRAFGGRDLALGAVTLLALAGDDRRLAPALVAAGAFADLCDGGASLAARREIPPAGVATGVFALGAAALGAGLAGALRRT